MKIILNKNSKSIIAFLLLIAILMVPFTSFATKLYTTKLNKGDTLKFTGYAWAVYTSLTAARDLDTSHLARYMAPNEKIKILSIDGNVLKIGNKEYIYYGSTASTYFKLVKSDTSASTNNMLDKVDDNSNKKPIPEILPTNISLNKKEYISYGIEDNFRLIATVSPQDASNKDIFWVSTNTKVATVNNNGQVTIVGPGNATITAKSKANNKISASCKIKSSINILFVGNSKTYYNKMTTKIFKPMAEKAGKFIHVGQITYGGTSLLWKIKTNKEASDRIKTTAENRRWDYVVLQEHGTVSYDNYEEMEAGIKELVDTMKKSNPNIKIIYNSVWMSIKGSDDKETTRKSIITPQGKYYQRQQTANKNYEKIITDSNLKGKIVYSGQAFIKCWQDTQGKKIQLYRPHIDGDWTHPSPEGSFLEACCIYSTIFGEPKEDILLDSVWNYNRKKSEEEQKKAIEESGDKDKKVVDPLNEEAIISKKDQKTLWRIARETQ